MSTVSTVDIEILGEDHIYHKRGFPYVDPGANAKAYLTDGSDMDVLLRISNNSVPSPCDTLGKYVVEYEAVSPYGFLSFAQRIVEVGQYMVPERVYVVFLFCVTHAFVLKKTVSFACTHLRSLSPGNPNHRP